jgi:glycosyltransferase involved in cell wall biosynthesis
MLRQLPFVVSAHAKDIWTTPSWEIAEKIADAQWVTTCTAVGAAHLRACAAPRDAARVHLNYHGIDLDCFARPDRRIAERDGSDPAHPAILLSVGRLVAKKGYDDLLRALALLPDGLHWRFVHVGGGPLKRRLIRLAKQLGIDARIDWLGRQAQTEVLARLRTADLFVLASRIADDGDRDGLPNVLMEAQSQDVACVATRVAGIPELITDGVTGRLVEPRDTAALRDAIADLIIDTHARVRLGTAGAAWLRERFAMTAGHDAIAGALRGALFTPAGARRP